MRSPLTLLLALFCFLLNAAVKLPPAKWSEIFDESGQTLLARQKFLEGDAPQQKKSELYSATGELLAKEVSTFRTPPWLLSYELQDLRNQARSYLQITDKKANLLREAEGKIQEKSIEAPDNLLAGPSVVLFILERWQDLLSDQKLNIHYYVPDRNSHYAFQLKKVVVQGQESTEIVIQMTARSPIVRMFAKPAYFFFSAQEQKLKKIKARSLINISGEKNSKAGETLTRYHYTEPKF